MAKRGALDLELDAIRARLVKLENQARKAPKNEKAPAANKTEKEPE